MGQVHGRKPHPHDMNNAVDAHLGEEPSHEEHLDGRTARMKGGKGTKYERRVAKCFAIQIES